MSLASPTKLPSDLSPRRILAVGREHIGDIVNTTPYLMALAEQFPAATLIAEVGESTASLLENAPYLAEVWSRPTHEGVPGKYRRVARMRRGQFDLTVIFDDSQRFVLEAVLAGIPVRAGIYRKGPLWPYSTFAPWSREGHDLFDPFDLLLENLGCRTKAHAPTLYPTEGDSETARSLFAGTGELGKGLICLNPCSNRSYNTWRTEGWAEVAREVVARGFRPAFIGPPNHSEGNQKIALASGGNAIDFTGKLGLLPLHELLRMSKGLISVDTGTVHIGVAARVPVTVLYGPTDPKRFHPWGDRWEATRAADHRMASIEATEVITAFDKLVERFP